MAKKANKTYIGNELEIFSAAKNWGFYIASVLFPYLRGEVVEIGSGIGTRTKNFHMLATRWLAVEPDTRLCKLLIDEVKSFTPCNIEVINGFIESLPNYGFADSILYVDVLEHIKDDQEELILAASKLKIGGHLIVLSPAHNFLFSEFDHAIGHYRRYSRASLLALGPPGCVLIEKKMLDSVGLLASLSNVIYLKKAIPTRGQIYFWDRFLVPLSRLIDRVLFYRFGKSIFVVWKKID